MAASQVQKNLPRLKKSKLRVFVGPVPEAEFATPDSTEETQEYVPQQQTQEYTAPLAAEQRRSLLVQMLQKQAQLRKNKRPLKRRGEKKLSKKKIGIISAIAVLVIALVAAFLLPVNNACRSDCR